MFCHFWQKIRKIKNGRHFWGGENFLKIAKTTFLKQFVHIENNHSDVLNVICGVPQGSILGPKLFILYINDLCNVSKLLNFLLFADDTNSSGGTVYRN